MKSNTSALTVGTNTSQMAMEELIWLVEASVTAAATKLAYRRALVAFLPWLQASASQFDHLAVQRYRDRLIELGKAPGTVKVQLAAIRRLAQESAKVGMLADGACSRIRDVQGMADRGNTVGDWLTVEQAEALLAAPKSDTLIGLRDLALLSLLIGCGLRRAEAVSLTWAHIERRENRWVIANLRGKGNRKRTVAMPGWAKGYLDGWRASAESNLGRKLSADERVLLPIRRTAYKTSDDTGGKISGSSLADLTIFKIVTKYTRALWPELRISPHDLRRTFARLAYKGKANEVQIQMTLGHSDLKTTLKYIAAAQDFEDAPGDRLGLHPRR